MLLMYTQQMHAHIVWNTEVTDLETLLPQDNLEAWFFSLA